MSSSIYSYLNSQRICQISCSPELLHSSLTASSSKPLSIFHSSAMAFMTRPFLLLAVVSAMLMAFSAQAVADLAPHFVSPFVDGKLEVDYTRFQTLYGEEFAASFATRAGSRKLLQYDSNHPDSCQYTAAPGGNGYTCSDNTCPGCQWCYSWGCFQASRSVTPYDQGCGQSRVNQLINCVRYPNQCGVWTP